VAVDDGLNLAVALGRYAGGDVAILQVSEDGVGVVAFVALLPASRGRGDLGPRRSRNVPATDAN
jgi:hypothetical protein